MHGVEQLLSYRAGFWILACVIFCGLVLMLGVLYVYDQSLGDIWERAVFRLNLHDTSASPYTYLPDHYYDRVNLPLPHSYHNIKSVDEFEKWRSTPGGILREWEDRPTTADIPSDITPELVAAYERTGYTLNKFNMQSFFDPEVAVFYEVIPHHELADGDNGDGKVYDAVFVIPGSGHTGALDALGEDGPWAGHYYHDGIAQTVAREGYATYVIELRGYGERAIDAGNGCKADDLICSSVLAEKKLGSLGISMNDIRTDEITQILAWIESRQYINNIAMAGLSLGGALALDQAIVNTDVLDAVVIASGISSKLHSPLSMGASGHDMTHCCDVPDYAVTIAPMPAYVSYGLKDPETLWEVDTAHTANMMTDAYNLHGKPENFWYVVHEGGHAYDTESVLDFLKTHLSRGLDPAN